MNLAAAALINLHSGIASPAAPCKLGPAVGPTDGSSSKGSEFALIRDENGRILPTPFELSM